MELITDLEWAAYYHTFKIDQIVEKLNADEEDGWSYEAVRVGEPFSSILVKDEDGKELGYL